MYAARVAASSVLAVGVGWLKETFEALNSPGFGAARPPAQFTDAGFVAFNRHYVERLAAWGIFREEVNPVARSNGAPGPTTPAVIDP